MSNRAEDWIDGIVETESNVVGSRSVHRLALRDTMSGPGVEVKARLHQVQVVSIAKGVLHLRGIEEASIAPGRPAAVIQEWLVQIER